MCSTHDISCVQIRTFLGSNQDICCVQRKTFRIFASRHFLCSNQDDIRTFLWFESKHFCVQVRTFRVFTSADVVGLEVGGAVKNVLALAAGMCEGLDLGTNAVTALVTRGLYEMQRIALAMGGRASTIAGLSGVGDTFGTCFGPLSRNRNTGVRLGRGERLDDILADMGEVAEGVETAFALERLIKKSHKSYRLDLKFPIIFGVAEILRGDRTPREGLEALMGLPLRPEFIAPVSDAQANRRRPLIVVSDYEIGDSDEDDRDIDFAD